MLFYTEVLTYAIRVGFAGRMDVLVLLSRPWHPWVMDDQLDYHGSFKSRETTMETGCGCCVDGSDRGCLLNCYFWERHDAKLQQNPTTIRAGRSRAKTRTREIKRSKFSVHAREYRKLVDKRVCVNVCVRVCTCTSRGGGGGQTMTCSNSAL